MIAPFLARHFCSPRNPLTMDPRRLRIAECLHALEPRYLFDAAGVAVGAEAAADALAQEQADQAIDARNHAPESSGGKPEPGSAAQTDSNDELLQALTAHEPPAGRREIVFIDTSVEDYQKLMAGIDPSAEVVLLDPTRDGVEQIADVLASRSGIDAIHIVSHGSQAELQLGTTRLTLDSMTGRYADELATIGQTLTDEADLLVYGCNFGEGGQGQEAAATLAKITGADVAASKDATGHSTLGGDWDLEFRAGSVETTAVLSFEAQASFMGLLAAPSVDLDANNSSGTLSADYTARYAVAGGSLPVTDIDARLADADSATLSSLTVTLTNRPNGVNESLSADTTGTSITASYNSGSGELTLSGADTVGNYQRVLRTIGYRNTAASPDRADRVITFVANDSVDSSNTATTTVRWENVRDDFTPVGVENAYNGNDGSANWSTDWQEVGESDGPAAGEVRVTSGSLEIRTSVAGLPARGAMREVNLSGAASAVLSFSYQQSAGLVNTSEAYVQVWNAVTLSWDTLWTYDLDDSDPMPIAQQFDLTPYISSQTRIQFITNAPSFGVPTSSISFDDIDISYDAPGATPILDLDAGAPGTNFATTFSEGAGPLAVADTDAALTDADSTMLTEIVVTITNPLDGAAESLSWDTGATGIIANYDSATFTLTFSGTNTVVNYEQVLRTVRYDNSSQSPNTTARTITFQASDGIDHSNVALATVTVNAVNDPPVVTTTGSALAYTENDPPTAVDSGLTVSDVDNTTLTGATVTLSANYVNGEDVLGFMNQLGITGSWNVATGTLTLTGTTTLADYQAALRTIAYANLSNGPSTLARTVSFVVNDGSANSPAATRSLNIAAVNDEPVITSNGGGITASVSIAENTTAVTTITATDPDLPAQALSYAISGGADAALFTIDSPSGVLRFNVAPDFEAPADANADNVYEVTVQASDGSLADTQALSVTVTPGNDAPSGTDTTVTTDEDLSYSFATVDFGFSDGDPGDVLSAARIDTLPAAGSLTLSGVAVSAGQVVSAADLTAGNLFFTPAPDANGAGYASFSFSVRDTGGSAFDPTPNTMTVDVTAVNDAPVNTVPGPQTVAENSALALSGVSVSDAEGNLSTLALSVANGTLTVILQGGATISAGANGSADLTLSGTQADLAATLASLVYRGNYIGPDTLTITSTDSSRASDTDTIAITVIAGVPADTAPPGTGGGTSEGPPSTPGPTPSPGDSLPSEVGDGDSSKASTNRNTITSDNSRIATSAASTRAPAVSSKDLGSDKNFIDGTSRGLGSKPLVAKETKAADVQDTKDPYSTLKDNRFLEELNRLRDDMNHPLSMETVALSMGLSVGYAIWLLRGGVLLSSLLSSLPAWRWLDPLPVLAHLRDPRDDEEGNEDSLQALLKNAEARDQSTPIPDVKVVPPAQQAATGAALSQPDATASLQEKADSHVSPHIPSPCQGEACPEPSRRGEDGGRDVP